MVEGSRVPGDRVEVAVPALLDGVRLDRAVSMLTGVSRALASRLIDSGSVQVDGDLVAQRSSCLTAGSLLSVDLGDSPLQTLDAEHDIDVDVVYADDQVIVVNKPAGLVVHPGAGRDKGTLVNGLIARFEDLTLLSAEGVCDPQRPGIVHRLDKGTSGLLVVARTPRAYESLVGQLSGRTVDRRYVALVYGSISDERGVVDAPVGRSVRVPSRMTVTSSGREARTAYRVLRRYEEPTPMTLIALALETGRTHQIRVHMSAIGHPVVGDTDYYATGVGARPARLEGFPAKRLFLHAFLLGFDHPRTGERSRWVASLPSDLGVVIPDEIDLAQVAKLAT